MTQLDKNTLLHLTHLCHIYCSNEELETFLNNLQSILGYIDQLQEVNTEDVPVCTHVREEIDPVLRDDVIQELLDREIFLNNAPCHIGGMVRVPTVISF